MITSSDPAAILAALRFGPDTTTDSSIYALKLVGTLLYVGGKFTQVTDGDGNTVTRNKLCCVDTTTGLLTSWDPNISTTTTSHRIETIQVDGSGKLMVGGVFSTVGGTARAGIARINTDGTLDTAFTANVNASATVYDIAVNAGLVYFCGGFTSVNGTTRNRAAVVNSSGTVQTMNPNLSSTCWAVCIAAGYVYWGGDFSTVQSLSRPGLCAFDIATETLQATFGSWLTGTTGPRDLIAAGSWIYAVGTMLGSAGVSSIRYAGAVAQLPSTGVQTWYPLLDGSAQELAHYGTSVVIVGGFNKVNTTSGGLGGTARSAIAEVNDTSGTIVAGFVDQGIGLSDFVWCLQIDGAGKIYYSVSAASNASFTIKTATVV